MLAYLVIALAYLIIVPVYLVIAPTYPQSTIISLMIVALEVTSMIIVTEWPLVVEL